MKIKIFIILIFTYIILQASNVCAAEIHLNNEMNSIPAKISDVYTCGQWKYNGKTGFYRIIYIEYHYGCSLLYIQWMLDREFKDGNTEVMHTLSIVEFNSNDHNELTFGKPICKETKSGIKFNILADFGHDSTKQYLEIKIHHKFGQYDFKDKTRKSTADKIAPPDRSQQPRLCSQAMRFALRLTTQSSRRFPPEINFRREDLRLIAGCVMEKIMKMELHSND